MKHWITAVPLALAMMAFSSLAVAGEGAPASPLATHSIDFDLDFQGSGMRYLDPPSTSGYSNVEGGRRVFPWTEMISNPFPIPVFKGYYVVGAQNHTDGRQRAWITRVNASGVTDTSFGTNGYMFRNAQDNVVDAWVDGDKAYVVSNIWGGTSAPPAIRVDCVDLVAQDSLNCFGILGGTLPFGASDAGPRTAAYAQRLAKQGGYLYVAARIQHNTLGKEIAVAKISAANGALDSSFGSGGYVYLRPSWAKTGSDAEVVVNDLLVDNLDGPRVIIAGHAKGSTTDGDTDGYLLGLSSNTGVIIPEWDRRIYFESDNGGAGFKDDSVTALTKLRGNKLGYAGWSATNDAQYRPMIMGRFNSNGSFDTTFCPGLIPPGTNANACDVEVGVSEFYKPDSQPVALVQREDNDNLIVALRSMNYGSVGPGNVTTRVMQYGPNGNILYFDRLVDYAAAAGEPRWSRPFGMWVSKFGGGGKEAIAVVGTRYWNSTDYDATVTRLLLTDDEDGPAIFSDGFED